MADKVIIIYREQDEGTKGSVIRALRQIWGDRGYETAALSVREELPWENYKSRLQAQENAYLVTVDMAGFGWTTLLEGSAYNLLPAKQLHLLTEDRGQYDMLLQKEYAINLFFFTDNSEILKDWERRYPLLPHLEFMAGPEALDDVVDKVIEYTRTAG